MIRPVTWLGTASILAVLTATPADAQSRARPAAKPRSTAAVPHTVWGDPDLQGIWTNTTTTPLERPDNLAGKQVLADEERAELDAQAARTADRNPAAGNPGTYNDFWLDRGKHTNQTSLIIDPPDGKLPPLTPAARAQQKAVAIVWQNPPSSHEDVSLFERCISRSMPAAMMPGFYNHNYQIFQSRDSVVLQVEMIHDTRVIPLDGRPHLPSTISQWLGDSRGHWEGDTLVVETTNLRAVNQLRPSHTVFSGSAKTRVVERFRRVDADTIDYQFTVTDPETFTRPWTASIPMTRAEGPIFEYACHEGNYAIGNILRGARREESAAERTQKP
jgi:hypothetical protein